MYFESFLLQQYSSFFKSILLNFIFSWHNSFFYYFSKSYHQLFLFSFFIVSNYFMRNRKRNKGQKKLFLLGKININVLLLMLFYFFVHLLCGLKKNDNAISNFLFF